MESRSRLAFLALVAVFRSGVATAQESIDLFKNAEGNVVLTAVRQPDEVLPGGCFLLTSPDGDVFFDDPAVKVVTLRDVPRVAQGGRTVLRLLRADDGNVVEFPEDGIHVREAPPGYVLLDIDGHPVDLPIDMPLVIENPLDVENPNDSAAPEEEKSLEEGLAGQLAGLTDHLKDALLEDPDTANKLLRGLLDERGPGFLDDLNLEVRVIQKNDGEDTLGVGYDFAKTLVAPPSEEGTTYSGWELELVARGTVAFEEDVNPEDFLETRLVYKFFRSTGGVRSDAPAPTEQELDRRLERLRRLADLGEDFKSSKDFREHSAEVRSIMTPQLHFDIGLNFGLESDQDFTAKNLAYGLQALLDYKVWDPTSTQAKFNVLDLPFAALRLLTGYDEEWQVRGSTFPTVLVAIEQIEPDGDSPRDEADDGDSYARLRGEVSFRTPIAWLDSSQTFFNANYRIYSELSPSDAVEDAGFDDFDYVELSLTTDQGFLLSYTSGQLPFDVENASALQAGWQFHL